MEINWKDGTTTKIVDGKTVTVRTIVSKRKYSTTEIYKGYGISKINGEYRANCYANPQFANSNIAKLKKEINQYLKK